MNRGILIILSATILSGCSSYKSSFGCGDAMGANCMSMDRVDRMIASGEIDRFNESEKQCRGRRCKPRDASQFIPALRNDAPMSIYHSKQEEGPNV